MIRLLGLSALAAALALAVVGAAAAALGARRRRPEWVELGARAAYANFVLLSVSNLAMIYALLTHDFSVGYVAQVGSRATPTLYTIVSLWGALEGSILFWGWVLAAYTAAVVWIHRDGRLGLLLPYANAVLLGVGVFFYGLLVGPSNPFERVWPVPPDGPGPNPLLQNHPLMAVHPPLLYLGYVGMTVPFALAMGALMAGRLDDAWLRASRRWTVAAWAFLSLAIVAGMWWSYEVLGWGGYWAWDPVENASFLPWLTATAFIHSSMVQERKGLLGTWNLSLIVSTFLLTILGTFLTRSGIISSVHAFTQGTIGYYFLAFIAVALLFSLALLTGRGAELARGRGRLDGVWSRSTVFLLNNLLLSAFCFTVLLGTLFPLMAEAVRGVKVSVGAPFFNAMTMPLALALLFLVGVGPALPWRAATRQELVSALTAPFVAMIAAVVLALALGATEPLPLLAFAFAAFALTTNLAETWRGAAARRRAHGEGAAVALGRLVASNPRRYGGYLAHMGVVAIAVGIAASSGYRAEREVTLRPGESMQMQDYTLRLERIWAADEPQRFVVGANLTVQRNGQPAGTLDPRMNFYPTSEQPVPTPAVRSRLDEDLYINLLAFERDGSSATLSVIVEPLVGWIWIGGLIVALGAFGGLLPARRRRTPAAGQGNAEPPREPALTGEPA